MSSIVVSFDSGRIDPFSPTKKLAMIALVDEQVVELGLGEFVVEDFGTGAGAGAGRAAVHESISVEDVAEAVFEATNSPHRLKAGSLAQFVRQWFTDRHARRGETYPTLSVGDVVTFRRRTGSGAQLVERVRVAGVGFEKVEVGA